jgi:hypothetical protein
VYEKVERDSRREVREHSMRPEANQLENFERGS